MSFSPIPAVTGRAVHVPGDDIDTDRIIPARFMKCITFDGLGEFLFYDVRKDASGKNKAHNLNDPSFAGASILISGNNFGCGSSREHAPQAIKRAGFNAVIAGGFAEIFFGNSTNLGVVCVIATDSDRRALVEAVSAEPSIEVTIDLEATEVRYGKHRFSVEIKEGARESLLNGSYDPLNELLQGLPEVESLVESLPYKKA